MLHGGAIGLDDSSEVVATPHTVALEPAEASGCRNYQGPAWYRKHFVQEVEDSPLQMMKI